MATDLFDSCVRDKGDLAGVFEYDGETGYFYLYDVSVGDQRVVDSIHVLSGSTDLEDGDISVRWDDANVRVSLFVRNVQWAVFNCATGAKFGGDYQRDGTPQIPDEEAFQALH